MAEPFTYQQYSFYCDGLHPDSARRAADQRTSRRLGIPRPTGHKQPPSKVRGSLKEGH